MSPLGQLVYLNGDFLPKAGATVSVDDRGWLFGDGVYEVIRACEGRWFEAEAHLARLQHGLAGLEISAVGEHAVDRLLGVCDRLLAENGLAAGHAVAYLQITRGTAPRTHQFPPPDTPPTVYVAVTPFQPKTEQVERGAAAITYPDLRWARCDLKTVNLLPNVLAKQAATAAGATEAILVRDEVVTEGSHTTVMAMLEGELRTHPRSERILPGVTRDLLLEWATEQGIAVNEIPIRAEDLLRAEELFVCGTTMDVTPIVRLDGRVVGDGRPGPVARLLATELLARLEGRVPASAPVGGA